MKKLKKKPKINSNYSKKATKNRRTVYFYEDTHEYIDNKNIKYTSVTTFIKKYFPEFNELEQAKIYSERSQDPFELVLNYWKARRDIACEHGTNVHLSCEEYIKNKKFIFFEKEKTNKCSKAAIRFIKKQKIGDIIACEKLLFDVESFVAGQCDLIMRNKNTLIVGDWKTNESLKMEAFDDEMGLPPFDSYPNSDYFKYLVQLNIYLYLIIKNNYYPWAEDYKLLIFHISENEVKSFNLDIIQDTIKKIFK